MNNNNAVIVKINYIEKIKSAQLVEKIITNNDISFVCEKGIFKRNDLAIWIKPGAFLPKEKNYDFLEDTSFRRNRLNGSGYLIKKRSILGIISEGLLLDLSYLPDGSYVIGEDVSDLLGLKNWKIPKKTEIGNIVSIKPSWIPKISYINSNKASKNFESIKNKPYYILEKVNGVKCNIFYKDGEIGVCVNNYLFDKNGENPIYEYIKTSGLYSRLKNTNKNILFNGVFVSPRINGNPLKLSTSLFFCYDIYDLDNNRFYNFEEVVNYCLENILNTAPIIEVGDNFLYEHIDITLKVKEKYTDGLILKTKEVTKALYIK